MLTFDNPQFGPKREMTILENLKSTTSQLHSDLEKNKLLALLTSDNLTHSTYSLILKKFYGYFGQLEMQLENFTPAIQEYLPDFAERRKATALLNDLNAMEGNMCQEVVFSVNPDLPKINNLPAAFGCLYVMEGSTLGGKLIARHVQHKLGISQTSGTSFFTGYGDRTGERWKVFREALLSFSEKNKAAESQVIDAANQTFLKFNSWLSTSNV